MGESGLMLELAHETSNFRRFGVFAAVVWLVLVCCFVSFFSVYASLCNDGQGN